MPGVVVFGISHRFRWLSQSEGQIAHVLLTRSPLVYSRRSLTARLACVKHAASVRPEPGSNSPLKSTDAHRQNRQGHRLNQSIPADQPHPTTRRDHLPKEPSKQTPSNPEKTRPPAACRRGVTDYFVDFWHTVEFSRIKRTPPRNQTHPGPAPSGATQPNLPVRSGSVKSWARPPASPSPAHGADVGRRLGAYESHPRIVLREWPLDARGTLAERPRGPKISAATGPGGRPPRTPAPGVRTPSGRIRARRRRRHSRPPDAPARRR